MTITNEMREKACCEALNSYLFHHIWNEPSAEFRDNIKPTILRSKTIKSVPFDNSFTGSFSLPDANIILPTAKEPYYIWCISTSNFHIGLKIPTNTWISTADLANEYGTLLHMYGVNGRMFSKGFTYVYMNTSRSNLIICAKKHMVRKFLNYMTKFDDNGNITSNLLEDVYMTIYYDSDNNKDISVYSTYVENINRSVTYQSYVRTINNFLSNCTNSDQLQVFQNGIETTDRNLICPALQNDVYIDFIIDKNIEFTFDIDLVSDHLSTGNQNPVYLSTQDKIWKQLIHIPKEKNPNNYIITHNTCDFFVRRKYKNEIVRSDTYGLYLHRASTNRKCIYQVTHNDMSVPLLVIEAYRDYIQAQEVYLHGVVRFHDKRNVLTTDSCYINLLYSEVHDDDKIIDILCGKGPKTIPWWTADNLEYSAYVNMMFDTPNFTTDNFSGTNHMQTYVDAIGFYQAINLLCRRIVDTVITDSFTGELTFNLPILYYGLNVNPVLYLNGKYISRDYYDFINYSDSNKVTIRLNSDYVTHTGDKLTVVFFVAGNTDATLFTPTERNLQITVPYQDVSVFEIMNMHLAVKDLQGNQYKTGYYRRELDNSVYIRVQNNDGTCTVVFNDQFVNMPFLIESKYCSYYQKYNLDSYLESGDSIIIPITTKIKDDPSINVPVFNYANAAVYLNNTYLVRDVDYTIYSCTSNDGYMVNTELVVQTLDHFLDSNNTLEVYINVANIEDISTGFMINDILQDKTPVNLYYPNISMVHVDGKLERDVDFRGIYAKMKESKYEQGSIFEIQTAVPSLVKDFINKYSSNEDYSRIEAMNKYFYDYLFTEPDIILLERQHRIYSIYLNNFIQDIINGKRALADDPDLARMMQQIRPYAYLSKADICFKDLDKRFIDFYPALVNRATEPEIKHMIDRFVKAFMPSNEDVSELDTVHNN